MLVPVGERDDLLSNAIKYNRDGGTVTLSVQEGTAGRIAIVVSDEGHGIPAELLPRLFTPFDRLAADRGYIDGTGLGLTVTKSLVEAMGGEITLDSRPGVGSSFAIELPAVDPSPSEAAASHSDPSAPGARTYISKPRQPAAFYRAVDELLESSLPT